jgi:hypothetical protein
MSWVKDALNLSMRKANLERLLARRPEGIFVADAPTHWPQSEESRHEIFCFVCSNLPWFRAFDILAEGGDDLRDLPLSMRKANLARLLARRPDGIFVSDFEQGEIGPDLFRKVCEFGFEGLVSKRRDRPYQAGRSKHWIKIKNRTHPAMNRVAESFR